jgi:PST family polysaccharide transporter
MKIDQVMIGQMLGDDDVGIYSAAVRLTEVWYFIPMVITSSVFPVIVQAKKHGDEAYKAILQKLFLLMIWLSLGVACLIMVFAQPFVSLFFGQEFIRAAGPLAIQCWAGIFIFAGLVSNQWYLLENLSRYTLYRNIFGAGINVVLNFLFIPRLGINGAALATLLTQLGTSYLFDGINSKTRPMFRMKSKYFFLFLPITYKLMTKKSDSDFYTEPR